MGDDPGTLRTAFADVREDELRREIGRARAEVRTEGMRESAPGSVTQLSHPWRRERFRDSLRVLVLAAVIVGTTFLLEWGTSWNHYAVIAIGAVAGVTAEEAISKVAARRKRQRSN
jgi:uncharacterized membrane protein